MSILDRDPAFKKLISKFPIPRILGCGKEFFKDMGGSEVVIKCGNNYGTTIDMFQSNVNFSKSMLCKECIEKDEVSK